MEINKRSITILYFLLLFLKFDTGISQNQLSGKVYKAKDSTAIFGASVYYDGTSIGVSTDDRGYFRLPFNENNLSLIISSLGYEPVIIDPKYLQDRSPNIYLKEKLEQLGTVNLETDPWTRLKKLRIFKSEFLGKNKMAQSCEIINEASIKLRYIPSSNTLVASSDEPLIIENRYLGYIIRYNLTDFEVQFKTYNGFTLPYSTYYEGFSFFKPLKNRVSKKKLKNRKESYLGSPLHFMRSLYEQKLEENNFTIFHKRFQVPTYKYFDISEFRNIKKIELLADEIDILYNGAEQSGLKTLGEFTLDNLGNHSPPEAIILSGEMSKKRISELLPVDYELE